jgi:uncharacterized protein YndB with AHSA1/START domain
MNIEEKDNTLTLSRVYNAPKQLVFDMFQNPLISLWWGPESWPLKESEMDFRPGGTWQYAMEGPDGTQAWAIATYQEIDAPNKIVYRDAFCDADGTVNPSLPTGLLTFTFDEVNGQTTLTLQATYESAEKRQQIVAMGMVEGMKDTWNQLDEVLTVKQQHQAKAADAIGGVTPVDPTDNTTLQVR